MKGVQYQVSVVAIAPSFSCCFFHHLRVAVVVRVKTVGSINHRDECVNQDGPQPPSDVSAWIV